MAKSLHDPRYKRLVRLLVTAREGAGLTQREVAERLGKPASYLGKFETLQRRLDLIEILDVLDAIGEKPIPFLTAVVAEIRRMK